MPLNCNCKLLHYSAGHPAPQHFRGSQQQGMQIFQASYSIGLFDIVYREGGATEPHSGHLLFTYTEGITEAQDTRRLFYSDSRLREPGADAVLDLQSFLGAAPLTDDIAVVAIRRTGVSNGIPQSVST